MTWNYRIVREKDPELEGIPESYSYSIRDVYYDDGVPTSYGAEPQCPLGESTAELHKDFMMMKMAFDKKVLEVEGDIIRETSQISI